MTRRIAAAVAGIAVVLSAAPGMAWFTHGHNRLARAAVEALPESVPEYFRQGGTVVGHASEDPDVWRHPAAPQLRRAEPPEHFLDLELLEGRNLAPHRWQMVDSLIRRGQDPVRVGLLPYAIAEGAQKLTLAFAEHRRWPHDEAIRWKSLVYAGRLAHYAGDLVQPLHTTIHFDGRAQPDGESPRTGIHSAVDALFEIAPFDPEVAVDGLEPRPLEGDLLQAVMTRFQESHGLVDSVYGLEDEIFTLYRTGTASPQVVELTAERFRAGADFLAGLFLRAWQDSADIELPGWLDREGWRDPRARNLAERTMHAMGGREAFEAARLLHFTWQVERGGSTLVEREHLWDRRTGDYRLETRRANEPAVVVLLNLHTREGRVLPGDASAGGDEADALVEQAYQAHINDAYWLLMPWKWLDPGVQLDWEGGHEEGGNTWEVARLAFATGTGLTSGDRYWAWIDPETELIDRWRYVLQQEDGSLGEAEPTTWIWRDWQPSGDLLFAREREQLDAEVPAFIRFPLVEATPSPTDAQLAPLRER